MDTSNIPMTTVSGVLNHLRRRKKDTMFCFNESGFHAGKGKFYQPNDLQIMKTYRFEGDSNPSDMAVIYTIEANDGTLGYVLDSYGASSNYEAEFNDFLRNIPKKQHEESMPLAMSAVVVY